MLLIILILLLILGIAFWQFHQGVFSTLIMLILSIVAAMVAFNFYEALGNYFFTSVFDQKYPMYSYACSLIGLFTVTLLVLRILFDWLIPGNVLFEMWPNRIGAGVMGILVGMVLTGVLTIAIQMLPVSETFLTFTSHKDDLSADTGFAPFYPDKFVLGMVRTFSDGSLSSDTKWSQKHPEFLKELFARRNTVGLPGRADAKADALVDVGVNKVPTSTLTESFPNDPSVKNGQYYVVKADISNAARDEDNWIRLVGTHLMLTAQNDEGQLEQYYPVAFLVIGDKGVWMPVTMLKESEKVPQPARLVLERNQDKATGDKISTHWVFLLPANAKPVALTFRGVSTKEIDPKSIKEGEPSKVGVLPQAK